MADPTSTPLSNNTLLENRYRIRGLLGQGGMSRVYLADDARLGVPVAVKENLQTTPEAREQFEREARLLAHLDHPNLPRVIDHFTDAARARQYLVMDYIEGEDLNAVIKCVGPLPEATALNWLGQILRAVEYLHAQNPPIIHRDIKPANIKITPQGKAVLVDFGIAKSYEARLMTLTGARAVTPGYAPPEQYGMRTTERSDIYALGATLYTALTGSAPPEAPLRISGEAPLIPPSRVVPGKVSAATERAVLQALELETRKRWQSAGQMRVALTSPLHPSPPRRGEGGEVAPPTIDRPTVMVERRAASTKAMRSNTVGLIAMTLVGFMVLVCLIVVFVVGRGQTATAIATPSAPAPTIIALVATSTPTIARATPTPIVIVVTATPVPPTATTTPRYTPTPRAGEERMIGGAPMVYVPAGDFTMGSNDGSDAEKPKHTVYLDGFGIAKFLVLLCQFNLKQNCSNKFCVMSSRMAARRNQSATGR